MRIWFQGDVNSSRLTTGSNWDTDHNATSMFECDGQDRWCSFPLAIQGGDLSQHWFEKKEKNTLFCFNKTETVYQIAI